MAIEADPDVGALRPDGGSRRGRWAIVAVVALAVLLGLGVSLLWYGNTESLSFEWESPGHQVRPGEVVTVEPTTTGTCAPIEILWYRPAIFGRWQQTHVGQARDVVDWWSTESRSYSGSPACGIGSWTFTVPADVDGGLVAVCGVVDGTCVRLEVEA